MTTPTDEPTPRWRQWIETNALAIGLTGLAALVAGLVVAGIALAGGDADTPQAGPATTGSVDTTSAGETPPSSDGETPVVTQPAEPTGDGLIAVKIDNAEAARPQIGLNFAKYLLEVPAEGGITRFVGIFSPADILVGPVRSLRPVDVDLVPALANTVVSTGGQPFVVGPLVSNGVDVVDYDTSASPLQSLERPQPHHLFVNLQQVTAAPSPMRLPFGEPGSPSGQADTITVPYPTPVTWTFADGIYTRAEGSETQMVLDGIDGELVPLTTDTVVVMGVGTHSAGYTDGNGADVPDFDVIGSGPLYVFNGGNVFEGEWSRASFAGGYELVATDGTPLPLPESRAFIHLLDRNAAPQY